MYTLKIKWMRYDEKGTMVDETTLFIPADQVLVHGEIASVEQMAAWPEGTYFNYVIEASPSCGYGSRLIQVDRNDKSTWYLVSTAWILGPDGKTIERLI